MLSTVNLMLLSMSSLIGLAVLGGLWAWSWKSWLDLKRCEIGAEPPMRSVPAAATANAGNRIELADLRERIRKLEAIAAGVDF